MTIIVVDIITAANPPPILLNDEGRASYNQYFTHRVVQKDRKAFVDNLTAYKCFITWPRARHAPYIRHFQEAVPFLLVRG